VFTGRRIRGRLVNPTGLEIGRVGEVLEKEEIAPERIKHKAKASGLKAAAL